MVRVIKNREIIIIGTPVSLERNVTDQIQIYNKCCSSSPTQGEFMCA